MSDAALQLSKEPTPTEESRSVEDYLKNIYKLQQQPSALVKLGDLAQTLGVSPASATGMSKRLANAALVKHQPYKGVRLTKAGEKIALRTIRRHRLVELLLTQVLGYSWDEVDEEAEQLEHAISDTLADRISALLGEPEEDPHGDPIPTRDGVMPKRTHFPLADADVGSALFVSRVSDHDPSFLRYCHSLGLQPGQGFTLRGREPYGGPLLLEIDNRTVNLGPEAAAFIFVEIQE